MSLWITFERCIERCISGDVKVMIAGAPVTRGFADSIGAKGFAEDCALAVEEAARLMPLVEKERFR